MIQEMYDNKYKLNKSLNYLTRSLKMANEINSRSGLVFSLQNLGNIYYFKGEYNKAAESLEKSLSFQKESGMNQIKLELKKV